MERLLYLSGVAEEVTLLKAVSVLYIDKGYILV